MQQTLQLLHLLLRPKEFIEILEVLNTMNGTTPKQGMQQVSNHTYILGKMIQRRASTDECELLNISHGLVQIYTRVFNGTLSLGFIF